MNKDEKEKRTGAPSISIRLPSYYAVLPAKVRYDPDLPPNAKLLYAEITALAGEHGYCWAQNSYLSKLFGVTTRTVSGLVGQLEKKGYITTDVVRDRGTNQVMQRRIWIDDPTPPEGGDGADPMENMFHTPMEKIFAENNTSNILTIPPISPIGDGCANAQSTEDNTGGGETPAEDAPSRTVRRRRADRGRRTEPSWKPERFAGLWSFYPAEGRKNKQRAIDAWDRLRPDDGLIDTIAKALVKLKASDPWQRGVGIPYVATFLRGARWEDAEVLEEAAGGKGAKDAPGGWAEDEEVLC